jgi:tRNA (guanine37-N1)-methyltransferase
MHKSVFTFIHHMRWAYTRVYLVSLTPICYKLSTVLLRNDDMFSAHILTLFPELFPGPLGCSVLGKALNEGRWGLQTHDIRTFATDKHGTVDDTPYGGGAGMVMKPDVVGAALEAALAHSPNARRIYLSPRGKHLTQPLAAELAESDGLILLCGRYEGVDARVLDHYAMEEVSIGDVVLTGGEVAAMAVLESVIRLLPGVVGQHDSLGEESFGLNADYALLLEYPHYTKPPIWKGLEVPEALLSGHHAKINAWRKTQAEALTQARRPDLWQRYEILKTTTQNTAQKK